MIISKTAINKSNYLNNEYYYNSARESMFDLFQNMIAKDMIDTVLLPGYIGWSPNEGSGIFDPINDLDSITVQYYKMKFDLCIDYDDLQEKILKLNGKKFAVLIVNYFGFVDSNIRYVTDIIRKHSGWIIEDNAHGFFTYQYTQEHYSDATFFSLHKMLPFKCGGSLILNNNKLKNFMYKGKSINNIEYNPWQYDVKEIAKIRRNNYSILEDYITKEGNNEYFAPLKTNVPVGNIPQTFPICIYKGDRNKIYELMNKSGYGVVSLYHTLIEPLRNSEYQASLELSKCIMNLPVHQDVNKDKYKDMVSLLIKYCKITSKS